MCCRTPSVPPPSIRSRYRCVLKGRARKTCPLRTQHYIKRPPDQANKKKKRKKSQLKTNSPTQYNNFLKASVTALFRYWSSRSFKPTAGTNLLLQSQSYRARHRNGRFLEPFFFFPEPLGWGISLLRCDAYATAFS
jgi:hypothetical protein